jgi:hypothetical protein
MLLQPVELNDAELAAVAGGQVTVSNSGNNSFNNSGNTTVSNSAFSASVTNSANGSASIEIG